MTKQKVLALKQLSPGFPVSKRLQALPPYLFVEIDKAKRKARAEGRDIIDLGIGDPDQPTPAHIIERLRQAAGDPANHRYALDQGMPALRQEIAAWYHRRFGVSLDPDTEILPLIGSKEGIAHLPLAFVNPGEAALVPDPCYPPYKGGVIFAGGTPVLMPLREENGFLPDLDAVSVSARKKARLFFMNYPNNPTGSVADAAFYGKAVQYARRHRMIAVSDLAYSEMSYDGYRPQSFLEIPGAREVGIEFHSLSKTYNMTGWRVGWACGNAALIAGLAKVKSNIDSGIFTALQHAAVAALQTPETLLRSLCAMYQARRDALVQGLRSLGWSVSAPKATFYLWVKIPVKKMGSIACAAAVLERADIVVTPGVGFGAHGEGYIRMALTVPEERIREALRRLESVF